PLQDVSALSRGTNPPVGTSHNAGNPDFLGLVLDRPPFRTKQRRQGMAWAIARHAMLKIAYCGGGKAGVQEVASGSAYYTTNDPYRSGPDLDKAHQLMKDAGLSNGVQIEYLGLPQYPEMLKTGEIVKEQLAQIGIQMSITQMEVTVWVGLLVK